MPYNNTPITPSKEVTGTVSLPLARVKKIVSADDDIAACSNNAAFVITVATEMFLQHIVDQSYNIVKSERKPRRNIQYRDVANAVARVENLEFLTDVVPKTTTFKKFKQNLAREQQANGKHANGRVFATATGGIGRPTSAHAPHNTNHTDAMDVADEETPTRSRYSKQAAVEDVTME